MAKIIRMRITVTASPRYVWRVIDVSSDATVEELCYTILDAFNANDYHLFSLEHKDIRYEINSELPYVKDPREIKIEDLHLEIKDNLFLLYDYGSEWGFKIVVKEIIDVDEEEKKKYPLIVKGKGWGIVEFDDPYGFCEMINYTLETSKPAPLRNGEGNVWDFREFDIDEYNKYLHNNIKTMKDNYKDIL